jgi:hypothetical protein
VVELPLCKKWRGHQVVGLPLCKRFGVGVDFLCVKGLGLVGLPLCRRFRFGGTSSV